MAQPSRYKPEHPALAYELALEGHNDTQIAHALGISKGALSKWANDKHPEVGICIDRGRARSSKGSDLPNIVERMYDKLPDSMKDVWDKLNDDPDAPAELTLDMGQKARMRLWMMAYLMFNFKKTRACRFVGIANGTINNWERKYPIFRKMLKEAETARDDMYQNAFDQLVLDGNQAAIIHAAKSRLAHRGYNEKLEVSVNGTIQHEHQHLVMTPEFLSLLSVDTRREILQVHEEQQALIAEQSTDELEEEDE